MTTGRDLGATRACARCGAARDGSRRCSSCGLDFWRAAAGDDAPTPEAVPGSAAVATRGAGSGGGIGLLAIGAGVVLLAVAGVAFLLVGMPAAPRSPARVLDVPPATHPLVLAFFSEARDPDAGYGWQQATDATLTAGDEAYSTTIAAEGRFAAGDWIARMEIVDDGQATFEGEVAVIGRHVYLREGDAAWSEGMRVPGSALTPINPFTRIVTVGDLDYVGPERRDGVDGHLLTTTKWIIDPELDDPIQRLARIRSRESLMEIHVDDAGAPMSAVHTYSVLARTPDGEDVIFRGRTTYTFADWDAVDPIEPPVSASSSQP